MEVKLIQLQSHGDERGSLVALEEERNIPFEIKRVYYMFNTKDGVRRGFHAHKKLKQVAIAVRGSCTFLLDDGKNKKYVVINELAIIFNKLAIDTEEVLEAAGSNWNLLPFRPGLVGGHCIGVDPYCLTYKAQALGYQPEVILAGRRINDSMGKYIAAEFIKMMIQRGLDIANANILVLGLAFKENCPDIRNTKVIDVIRECEDYGANVDVYDPWVNPVDARDEYGLEPIAQIRSNHYNGIIIAVAHDQFKQMGEDYIRNLGKQDAVLFDVKYILPENAVDGRL